MAINIPRGEADSVIDLMIEALRPYEINHPAARIDLYRQDPVSVRVGIIDPGFAGGAGPNGIKMRSLIWIPSTRRPSPTSAARPC